MSQTVEPRGDVSLDTPLRSHPPLVALLECSMAAPFGSNPLGVAATLRLVVRLQNEAQAVLPQLIGPGGDAERAFLHRVFLLAVDPPDRSPLVTLVTELVDARRNCGQGHPLRSLSRTPWSHCPRVPGAAPIGVEVPLWVVQLSIDVLKRHALFAAFANESQEGCGVSPLASLTKWVP